MTPWANGMPDIWSVAVIVGYIITVNIIITIVVVTVDNDNNNNNNPSFMLKALWVYYTLMGNR
jgi:hypothetical protein